MKRKLFDILKNATGNFVSGESIAEELKVTRTSIWKSIQQLKKFGYDIESRGKLGYKLNQIGDVLLPAAVQSGLHTKIIGVDNRMIYKISVICTVHFNKIPVLEFSPCFSIEHIAGKNFI